MSYKYVRWAIDICRNIIILMASALLTLSLYAQDNTHNKYPIDSIKVYKDSVKIYQDSLKVYRDIERFSKRHKILYELYKNVFIVPPSDTATVPKNKSIKKNVKIKPLNDYKGYTIRYINISVLDPLGYNIYDTTARPHSYFEKGGNIIHVKSHNITIKNQLLFKTGDLLDPLKIRESERLLRTSGYVRDAMITVVPVKNRHYVDVYILEQDRWSLTVTGGYGSQSSIGIQDNNFLGLGHQYQQSFLSRGILDSAMFYKGSYGVQYIRHTFITMSAFYDTDPKNTNHGVSIGRAFVSPLTAWAGGIDYGNYRTQTPISVTDTSARLYMPQYTSLDIWGGYSIPLGKTKTDHERATRLITTIRHLVKNYTPVVPIEYDPLYSFQSSDSWYISSGISKRTYYKDKYIYKFGVTEDVPTGFLISATAGLKHQPNGYTTYAGIQASFAAHVSKVGYFNMYGEAGTYPMNGYLDETTIRARLGYFTELIPIGTWKIRQFIGITSTTGLHRYKTETLTLNGQTNGLPGFQSPTLAGTNKFIGYIQTQIYLPYSLWGFRFAPIAYVGMGSIGTDKSWYIYQKIYPVMAVGVQVRNEQLVLNTFQVIVGFYVDVPGSNSTYKVNPLTTNTIQFQQQQMGKPGEVGFY